MNKLVIIPVPGTDGIVGTQADGKAFAALRPIVEMLGLDYSGQLKKLKSKSWAVVEIIPTTGTDGKTYRMVGIDRKTLTMYLATLDEGRVKPEIRPTLVALQAEAADALDSYFHSGVAVRPTQPASQLDVLRSMIDQIEAGQRDAAEAKALAVKTEARLDAIEGRHDWYSALGYARLHRLNTSSQYLNRVGRQASMIAKRNNIEPVKVPHQLFGEVNSYPAWIWELTMESAA